MAAASSLALSPEEFGSLASSTDSGYGRGDKHGAPSEEFKRGYKSYIGKFDTQTSTCSSQLLQDITAEQLRSGCLNVKGLDLVACEKNEGTVENTGNAKKAARARYTSSWRGLKTSMQPTVEPPRYKKAMHVRRQRTENAEQNSTHPCVEGTSVEAGTDHTGQDVPMPKVPSTPPTGRPQPGNHAPMLRNAAARVDSAGKAYHQEVLKVQKSLEGLQANRGDLRWEERIGTGSTAEVFKGAWSCMPGQELAIKRLNMRPSRSAQLKQEVALLREVALLATIQHDNLVKFYGFAFEEQPYLLITEFCKGGPVFHLLHVIDPIQLVLEQQLKMCGDVACAMNFLHKFQPQIFHRDLKSLNLLLLEPVTSTTDVPHVKVSDFGLSKMKDEDAGWDEMTVGVGTAHWMAPEVATGNYNEKADIYSFAMVLFEIICNEVPFEDLGAVEVLLSTSRGARPNLSAVPDRTPADLVALMQQCWAKEPSERPSFEYISTSLSTIGCSAGVIMTWGETLSGGT